MGLFGGQFANVVEWQEFRDDMLFWKWSNQEIKKGSRLIIRPGQDAIFLYNGKTEGIFQDEGSYDIESEIIPFLSTLKGFKFGFNSGIRAEVLFINTKEVLVKWGTKNPVLMPAPGLPGGMPIRSFGTFACRVADYDALIEKVAGIRREFTVEDVKERITSMLDQLLMKWIAKEGRDMFNLQINAREIGQGIQEDLDMEMQKIGIGITSFAISSFNYPPEVQKMAEKAAAQSMVGDVGRFQQINMGTAMGNAQSGGTVADMAGLAMGMAMGQQMAAQMYPNQAGAVQTAQAPAGMPGGAQQAQAAGTAQTGTGKAPNFCPNCGTKTAGANFCPNCGQKLV